MKACAFSLARRGMRALLAACALALPAQLLAAPPIVHWVAASGARVYFVEVHALPILDVAAEFPAGSGYEPAGLEGVAKMTHGLLKEDSQRSSAAQLGDRLASVGALVNPYFDRDRAGYRLRTLSSAGERGEALEVFAEMLGEPAFLAPAFERERARLASASREEEARPASLAERRLFTAMYGKHPYGGSPTEASLRAVDREKAVEFYRRQYGAAGAVITLVGDLSEADARALADRLTARLPRQPAAAPLPDPPQPQAAPALRIAHPSEQSHIVLGAPALARNDPDYFALYLGNYVLGGSGFVSRLYRAVREERGLAYSVYSYFLPLAVRGPFLLGLQTARGQTEQALATVREVLERFIAQGPTEAELRAAKQGIAGGFALRTDSNMKILNEVALIAFYRLPEDWLERFVPEVQKVGAAQVRRAFARHVDPARLSTVVVGAK